MAFTVAVSVRRPSVDQTATGIIMFPIRRVSRLPPLASCLYPPAAWFAGGDAGTVNHSLRSRRVGAKRLAFGAPQPRILKLLLRVGQFPLALSFVVALAALII